MEFGTLFFRCNICGASCKTQLSELRREGVSCESCTSSARRRAVVRTLSLELFGESVALTDFPVRRDLNGLGMTDCDDYALRLAEKFSYKNTYYHKEPKLDISDPNLPHELVASQDFIISSDVLEHVLPPVSLAFENVFALLRPGGVFILTVPYAPRPHTIEHFPDLHKFEVIEENGTYLLRNVTRAGVKEEFGDLVFHGGPGSTLEMRVFGEQDLIQHLQSAGFEPITIHRSPDFVHGIWWPEPWSLPISARKPDSRAS